MIGGVLRTTSVVGAVAVVLAAAAAGCGGGDGGANDAGAADGEPRRESPPFKARVEITEDGYRPRHVTILVGGSVTFVNVDENQSHTAETEDLPETVTDNNEFDTHTLTWEEPYTITFHKPETVRYFDSLSDFSGTVTAVTRERPAPDPPPPADG